MAVDDADASADRAVALGGTLVSAPADAGPGGRGAARGPGGERLPALAGPPTTRAQLTNAPGSWNFSNLHTADLEAAERFYGELFPWRLVDQGGPPDHVPGYGDHLEATVDPDIRTRQAGAPEGFEDVIGAIVPAGDDAPGWSVVFTVADRDASAARVVELGGTLLRSFETDWTAEAVVRDPQGAVFTISQYAPPDDWG